MANRERACIRMHPERDRLDYGTLLAAPEGHRLDSAIGTSYTLDLDTLLTISVALGDLGPLEGDLLSRKNLLIKALENVSEKVGIFYQKGRLKIPAKYQNVYILLEEALHEIPMEFGHSFHPKVWLLRFVEKEKETVRYRLIVGSRNMTFDKSWDIAMSIEGNVGPTMGNHKSAREFFESFDDRFDTRFPDFDQVTWETEPPLRNGSLEVLPLVGGQRVNPLSDALRRRYDNILVVSPFLSATTLRAFEKYVDPSGGCLLFSRALALNKIGDRDLSRWQCHTINERILDGSERIEEGDELFDLHAKMIVAERGNMCAWYIGSANATVSGMGLDGTPARNTECMLKFTTQKSDAGIDLLKESWLAENEESSLFVPHTFEAIDDEALGEDAFQILLDRVAKPVWTLHAKRENEDHYTLTLRCEKMPLSEEERFGIEISPLGLDHWKPIDTTLMWENTPLTKISAFIQFRIDMDGTKTYAMIKATLEMEKPQRRNAALYREIFDDRKKVLEYIRLHLDSSLGETARMSSGYMVSASSGERNDEADTLPLFEELMLSAVRHGEDLKEMGKTLKFFEQERIEVPRHFLQIWKVFEEYLHAR